MSELSDVCQCVVWHKMCTTYYRSESEVFNKFIIGKRSPKAVFCRIIAQRIIFFTYLINKTQ